MKTRPLLLALSASALLGCGSAATHYTPQYVARGELSVAYDDEYVMYADEHEVAKSSAWEGLTDFVHCVPAARAHAKAAEKAGTAAKALSVGGVVIGVGSLGTLGSLAVVDKDPKLTAEVLSAGVGAAAVGLIMVIVGRRLKPVANGHALDAMNHYNDALGSYGHSCAEPSRFAR